MRRIAVGTALLTLSLITPSAGRVSGEWDRVDRVIDGDTVVLRGLGRARLIGINAPERSTPDRPPERFGMQAAEYADARLRKRPVRIERGDEARDRHGRALVFLYLEDGSFINLELVRDGYAYAYTQFPFRYRFEFLEAEDEARREGKGLWAALSARARHQPFHGNTRSRVYHAENCEHYDCRECTVTLPSRAEAERKSFRPHWSCVGNR